MRKSGEARGVWNKRNILEKAWDVGPGRNCGCEVREFEGDR